MTQRGRPLVVLIGHMYNPEGEKLLAQHIEFSVLADPTPGEVLEAVRPAQAVVVRYPYRMTAEAVREARGLVVIGSSGRGTDAIDVAAATEAGVAVFNNPGLGARPVSEHAIGLMLDLARQTHVLSAFTHKGQGWQAREAHRRIELHGRTLGIIGLGDIGTVVAKKCIAAFEMRVLAYDPYVPGSKAEGIGATWVKDLDVLLAESDVVTVHAELNDETRGMIGEAQLRRMRPTAFLVNTARGPIVREAALARALREGWIAGAALDVYELEPLNAQSPLCGLKNLVLTPHVAGLTEEAMRELGLSAAGQVLQAMRGERPAHLVNPQVWEQAKRRLAGL